MAELSGLEDEITAFDKARGASEVALTAQGNLLRTIVIDAREQGMSMRHIARMLGIPKTSLIRQYHNAEKADMNPPSHADNGIYMTVMNLIYEGTIGLWLGWCPWKWEKHDGTTTIRRVGREEAAFSDHLQPDWRISSTTRQNGITDMKEGKA